MRTHDMESNKYLVQIFVMVWSEKSSGEIVGDAGVMGTHDMETYKFFKDKNNYNGDNKVMIY